MTNQEFLEITSDFDGFMRNHGYFRTEELGAVYGLKPVTIRGWITQGLVKPPDVVMIGNVNYIKAGVKPTKDRSKSKDRNSRYYKAVVV